MKSTAQSFSSSLPFFCEKFNTKTLVAKEFLIVHRERERESDGVDELYQLSIGISVCCSGELWGEERDFQSHKDLHNNHSFMTDSAMENDFIRSFCC